MHRHPWRPTGAALLLPGPLFPLKGPVGSPARGWHPPSWSLSGPASRMRGKAKVSRAQNCSLTYGQAWLSHAHSVLAPLGHISPRHPAPTAGDMTHDPCPPLHRQGPCRDPGPPAAPEIPQALPAQPGAPVPLWRSARSLPRGTPLTGHSLPAGTPPDTRRLGAMLLTQVPG